MHARRRIVEHPCRALEDARLAGPTLERNSWQEHHRDPIVVHNTEAMMATPLRDENAFTGLGRGIAPRDIYTCVHV